MNTANLREKLELTINGLLNNTMDSTTAHEVSNAAGKFVSTIKVDIMGEMLKRQIAGYSHTALTLTDATIEVEAE